MPRLARARHKEQSRSLAALRARMVETTFMENALSGLIAAPFTPMNVDGSLNLNTVERQAQFLVDGNVTGVFVCGTTGEGLSLSTQERMQVAERWVAAGRGKLKVIVHVGHNSAEESRALAIHASRIGAHACAAIGPSFFRPDKAEQLVEFCAQIAAAAPDLPFYYYHIPIFTGLKVPMIEFLRRAARRIPNLAGLKFTDDDLMGFAQCLNFEGGRFNILFGRDELLLGALALGATGAVGSTYNFLAPLYQQLIVAFKKGDLTSARRFQQAAVEIIALMNGRGGLPAGKAMMKLIGIDCGPVRLPLRNLTAEEAESLARELKALGFPPGK